MSEHSWPSVERGASVSGIVGDYGFVFVMATGFVIRTVRRKRSSAALQRINKKYRYLIHEVR
jgi:cobalamin biosynthesis protein CbiG